MRMFNKFLFCTSIFILGAIAVRAQSSFFKADSNAQWISMDLHIHTVFSDGAVWPSIRVEEARREGLDLIAMTEHLEYQPHAEDLPHPDRNRSFYIASEMINPEERLQVINGSEITREMPPGHINAVFVKDANKLLHKDSLTGIQEANKQNAFVFWNHPNWDAHRIDGIARLEPFHNFLISNKLLHGIEVVNETTFSEEALQIALDNDLTILGTSDIHGLTDWAHEISEGGHRPMTFVRVNGKSVEAIKKALFSGNTIVWYEDLVIGKEDQIKQLVSENIRFGTPTYPEDKLILQLDVVNESSVPFQMEYLGEYSFHQGSSIFILEPKTTTRIQIKTGTKEENLTLPFRILNALIGPKKFLEHEFLVK